MSPELQALYDTMVESTRAHSLAQTELHHHNAKGRELEGDEMQKRMDMHAAREAFQQRVLEDNTSPEERVDLRRM